MKLLFVIPEYLPSTGGIVRFYSNLLPALVRLGATVTVLVGSGVSQPGGTFTRDGVVVRGLDADRFATWRQRFPQLSAIPLLQRHIAAAWALREIADELGSMDAVEAADWGLLAAPLVLCPIAPLLVRCHASVGQIAMHERHPGLMAGDALALSLERSVLSRAGSVVTYGADNATQWKAWLGTDCAHREPALAVPQLRSTGSSEWWTVLARVQRWKGPQVLAAALQSMAAPPCVRWVGRDVPDTQEGTASTLRSMREGFPIAWQKQIQYYPQVDAGAAEEMMRLARGVLVPSTWDVFNFSGAEAMSLGALVISSDAAGVSHWIKSGENGFVVPSGSPTALAATLAIVEAMDNRRRRAIGDAARSEVARRADPDRVAQRESAALRSLVSAPVVEDPLDDLLRPSPPMETSLHGALAQYSLRDLAAHIAARALAKIRAS